MGQSMVLVHRWDLFHVFVFGKIGKKKAFGDILERKRPLQPTKTRSKKKSKNCLFKKGFVHGFGQKIGFFPRFHPQQNREGKSLCRYSRKKKRLSRLYNQGLKKKKEENWPFFQRELVHGFAPKKTFFLRFYLWQNRHRNKKTPFQAIQKVQTVEKLTFLKNG